MEIQKDLACMNVRAPSQSDYFPWQRVSRASGGQSRQSAGSLASVKSDENPPRVSVLTNRTACSSVCRHSWRKKNVVTAGPTNNEDADRKKQKLLSVLKMQVKLRESSLCNYKKRYQQLVKENLELKEEITSSEEKTHQEAKTLLESYKRFRGAIGTLGKQYSRQLTSSLEEFDDMKERLIKDIEVITVRVDELNRRLLVKNDEVTTLLNYKEKEYPGRALQIAKLKRQRERLNTTQKEELEELRRAMEEDRLKRQNKQDLQYNDARWDINEVAVRSLDTNIKDIVLQNLIMKKEIEIHANEIVELEESISGLEIEIRQILQDKNLNPAEQLFPDIFRQDKKCLPQDDINLDIPLQTWLPI